METQAVDGFRRRDTVQNYARRTHGTMASMAYFCSSTTPCQLPIHNFNPFFPRSKRCLIRIKP